MITHPLSYASKSTFNMRYTSLFLQNIASVVPLEYLPIRNDLSTVLNTLQTSMSGQSAIVSLRCGKQ